MQVEGRVPQDLLGYHDSILVLRIVLHVAIFAAAFLNFTLGLGVGLQLNPAAGNLLWLVADLGPSDQPQHPSGLSARLSVLTKTCRATRVIGTSTYPKACLSRRAQQRGTVAGAKRTVFSCGGSANADG